MARTHSLGVRDPHRHGFRSQVEYLSRDRRTDGICYTDYVGGRGSAKTTSGVLLLVKTAWSDMPGERLLWTEPTHADIRTVFWPVFRAIAPQGEYTVRQSPWEITCSSGTVIDVDSRQIRNINAQAGRGRTYAAAWHDEAAKGFDAHNLANFNAQIRSPSAEYLFVDTLSTPLMNDYYDYCHRASHAIIHATSYCNPFLRRQGIDDLADGMTDAHRRQELLGEWVAQSGRIWDGWSDDEWPNGNRWPDGYDETRSWWLSVDIGLRGYWAIWQTYDAPPDSSGRHDVVDVLVAEYVTEDGDVRAMVERIRDDMPTPPTRIIAGSDVGVRSHVSGDRATAYLLAERWAGVQLLTPTGDLASKILQYHVASGRICNARQQRRMCVARNLDTRHGAEHNRGILDVLRRDQWPDDHSARGDYFRKGKGDALGKLEDARDGGLLYPMVCAHPPGIRRLG